MWPVSRDEQINVLGLIQLAGLAALVETLPSSLITTTGTD
jgi:hypothetical protein